MCLHIDILPQPFLCDGKEGKFWDQSESFA